MPKLYLENGAVVEGSIDEIAELAKKLDCGEVTDGYRKITGRKPMVGDFVRFNEDGLDITARKYYEIVEVDEDGDCWFSDDNDDHQCVSSGREDVEFFEKVNTNADEIVAANPEPEFKVGDYVVALPDADGRYGITNTSMNLGKIIKVNGDEIRIEIVSHNNPDLVGNDFDVKKEYFRKASKREIVFGKAGRKLDEFKVGDIVRVLDGSGSGLQDHDGIITEIDEIDFRIHVVKPAFVNNPMNTWLDSDDLELIAPVENRVDR